MYNRITLGIVTFIVAVAVFVQGASQVHAEPQTRRTVTLQQVILPPDCYDTVMQGAQTTDYITVWECEIQRPQ